MENTGGQVINQDYPVEGCKGCDTTAGKVGCPIHNKYCFVLNDWCNCKKCGYGLAYGWKYCPQCGEHKLV